MGPKGQKVTFQPTKQGDLGGLKGGCRMPGRMTPSMFSRRSSKEARCACREKKRKRPLTSPPRTFKNGVPNISPQRSTLLVGELTSKRQQLGWWCWWLMVLVASGRKTTQTQRTSVRLHFGSWGSAVMKCSLCGFWLAILQSLPFNTTLSPQKKK